MAGKALEGLDAYEDPQAVRALLPHAPTIALNGGTLHPDRAERQGTMCV